jgi:hypothetical protein
MIEKIYSFNFINLQKYAMGIDVIKKGMLRFFLTFPKRQNLTLPKNVPKRLSVNDIVGMVC